MIQEDVPSRIDLSEMPDAQEWESRARGRPTESLVVRDNVMYHDHDGFIVGSEMSGGVRNVYAADLAFIGTDVGIRCESTRGRGEVVENIHISNVNMVNIVTEPIRFNLFYSGSASTENADTEIVDPATYLSRFPEVTEETPAFRNSTIRDVICCGAGAAMWIQGLPEMPIENLRLENLAITATRGASLIDVAGVQFDCVQVEVAKGPVLHLLNAQNLVACESAMGRAIPPMRRQKRAWKVRSPATSICAVWPRSAREPSSLSGPTLRRRAFSFRRRERCSGRSITFARSQRNRHHPRHPCHE